MSDATPEPAQKRGRLPLRSAAEKLAIAAEALRRLQEGEDPGVIATRFGLSWRRVQQIIAEALPERRVGRGQTISGKRPKPRPYKPRARSNRPRAGMVERRRHVAELRRQGWTLQRIGDHFGITRERVRQILDQPAESSA